MAKINTSALVAHLKGSLGGSTFKGVKSGTIIKSRRIPRRPQTEPQQCRRHYISQLTGEWFTLPSIKKDMWNKFASLVNSNSSGFNQYISLNMNIFDAHDDTLSKITSPPPTPSTPAAIAGFSVYFLSSVENEITWSYPDDADTRVIIHYAIQAGYSHDGKESWHFLITRLSNTGSYNHTHDFPDVIPGLVYSYKAYTMDIFGRRSPITATLKGPSFGTVSRSGRYGHTAYGFSFYGF